MFRFVKISFIKYHLSRYKSHNHFTRIIRYKYWLFMKKALFLVEMYRNIDLYFSHTFSLHAWFLDQCSLILSWFGSLTLCLGHSFLGAGILGALLSNKRCSDVIMVKYKPFLDSLSLGQL